MGRGKAQGEVVSRRRRGKARVVIPFMDRDEEVRSQIGREHRLKTQAYGFPTLQNSGKQSLKLKKYAKKKEKMGC